MSFPADLGSGFVAFDGRNNETTTSIPSPVTFADGYTAGDTIIVGVGASTATAWSSSDASHSIANTAGYSWTLWGNLTIGTTSIAIYYYHVLADNLVSDTITATSTGATYVFNDAVIYRGVGAIYGTGASAANATSSGSYSSQVGNLNIGFGTGTALTAGTGWVKREADTSSPYTILIDQVSTSTTANATENSTAGPNGVIGITFSPASSNYVMVADGDSITSGYGITTAWPSVFPVNTPVPITNVAVSGETLATMYANAPTVVDPFLRGGSTNVVVIWGGTNDIANLGTPVATVYSTLQSYCTARRTAGWKVVVVPMISRNGYDTQKNAYNSDITAGWSGFADALVTLPSTLMADGAYANTTYFQADGIHPTQFSASTLIAPAIATSVNAVLGLQSVFSIPVASDTFHRANGGLGANWQTVLVNPLTIVSNTVTGSQSGGQRNGGEYIGASFHNDQYSQVTVSSATGNSSDAFAPSVRNTAAGNCYDFTISPGATTASIGGYKANNYIGNLATFAVTSPAPGDTIEIITKGSWLGAYQNGVLVGAIVDYRFSSGNAGIASYLTNVGGFYLSAWAGGNIAPIIAAGQVGAFLVGP